MLKQPFWQKSNFSNLLSSLKLQLEPEQNSLHLTHGTACLLELSACAITDSAMQGEEWTPGPTGERQTQLDLNVRDK